jgi:hypothetical protein
MQKILVFLALALSVIIISCKKTTMVSGVITDSATGQPMKGVNVPMVAHKSLNRGVLLVDQDEALTDSLGQYVVEVSGKSINNVFILIDKDGYAYEKQVFFDNGSCTEHNWVLNPLDAYLSLKLINDSGVSGIFYAISGGLYDGVVTAGTGGIPLKIPKDSSLTRVIKIAGGGFNQVQWQDNTHYISGPLKNIDSVFCARNDTTYYELRY